MRPVMRTLPSNQGTSHTALKKKSMLPTHLHRLNNAGRGRKEGEKKRNNRRVLANHTGSDKASKLK